MPMTTNLVTLQRAGLTALFPVLLENLKNLRGQKRSCFAHPTVLTVNTPLVDLFLQQRLIYRSLPAIFGAGDELAVFRRELS